jgi:hypothetical protein
MEKDIYIPPSLTAHLQNIQHALAGSRAYFYCTDVIPKASLPAFIDRWKDYGLRCDAPARAYRKRVGRASVVLCISNQFLDPEITKVAWWMFSTPGKLGLADKDHHTPEKVKDARILPRLTLGDYEFLQAEKEVPRGEKATTWTWRMTPKRYLEWEAWFIERAKQHALADVRSGFQTIRNQPLAAGVRTQVLKLEFKTNQFLKKLGHPPIDLGDLPIMNKTKRKSDEFL